MRAINNYKYYTAKERKVEILQERISDPVILPSGKIYSARGIRYLLDALFPNCVDDAEHCCKEAKIRGRENVKRAVDRIDGGNETA